MSEPIPTMDEMEHVFVTVGNRRWSVCCSLFQQRRSDIAWTYPGPCPNDAPAAETNREHHEAKRLVTQGERYE